MMWNVQLYWPAGSRFSLNCYKNSEHLLLCQPWEPSVLLLIQEGVTQGDHLSIVLYVITLAPLVEEIQAADPVLLLFFYIDDVEFDRSAIISA